MDNIIQIRDLTFAYAAGDEPVLSDINIDIGSGEFVIIMGSSGSGKTTLLKMLKYDTSRKIFGQSIYIWERS